MLDLWSIFVSVVFVLITIYSLRKAIVDEAKKVKKEISEVLNEHFGGLVRHKDMVLVSSIFVLAAIPAFLLGNILLSFIFIEAPVLIFAIQTIYHLTPKWRVPQSGDKRKRVEWGIISAIVASGFLLAYFFFVWTTVFVVYSFELILFISGIGGIDVINTIATKASSSIKISKRWHFALLFGYAIALYFVLRYLSHVVPQLEAKYPQIDPSMAWTTALGPALLGSVASILVGIGYFLYLFRRKEEIKHSPTVLYLVLMLALSGLFIGFVFGSFGDTFSKPNQNFSGLPLSDYIALFVAPLGLFSVGYIQILFEVPRKLVAKFPIQEKRFIAALTFFLLFAGLAEYFGEALFSNVSAFFAEESYIPWVGMLFGGVLLAVRKNFHKPMKLAVILAGVSFVLVVSYFFLYSN